jgi:hypothetical protein
MARTIYLLNIIKAECPDIDILGTNVYRCFFWRCFHKSKGELNKPILFTEFGADAYNTLNNAEDQKSQAYYLAGSWKEIYENAAGLGKAGNSSRRFYFSI